MSDQIDAFYGFTCDTCGSAIKLLDEADGLTPKFKDVPIYICCPECGTMAPYQWRELRRLPAQ